MTRDYQEKVFRLFGVCSEFPPGNWEEVLSCSGETDKKILADVKTLLSNREKAGIFFDSLGSRIEKEMSVPEYQHIYSEGDRIGNFILKGIIRRGGMAIVYLAEKIVNNPGRSTDTKNQVAAIKVMSCHAGNPWTSFRKEQKLLSEIKHPNVAALYDYGITREGLLYIIMEYVDGLAVDSYCEKYGPDILHRLKLIIQVCDAIQYSHDKQIIHQDIKPANILVDKMMQVKVIDFGISAVPDESVNPPRTGSGFQGTISYASPEQLKGSTPSYSSDIFQIGMVMHKLITGTLPRTDFEGRSCNVLMKHSREKLSHCFRKELGDILKRSLSAEPGKRHQTVSALKYDIQKMIDRHKPPST